MGRFCSGTFRPFGTQRRGCGTSRRSLRQQAFPNQPASASFPVSPWFDIAVCISTHSVYFRTQMAISHGESGKSWWVELAKLTFDLNGGAEVYEQAIVDARCSEVVYELHLMLWREGQDCFELNYQVVV